MLQYTIVVGHVVRRLYSTGGMAGGVMSTMNNAIFEIVKREFAYQEKKDSMLCPTDDLQEKTG
jgi:hypothetical protein